MKKAHAKTAVMSKPPLLPKSVEVPPNFGFSLLSLWDSLHYSEKISAMGCKPVPVIQ
jgi:hypothetical protein